MLLKAANRRRPKKSHVDTQSTPINPLKFLYHHLLFIKITRHRLLFIDFHRHRRLYRHLSPSSDRIPTVYRPYTDWYRPYTDRKPTDTDRIPTDADRIPTLYRSYRIPWLPYWIFGRGGVWGITGEEIISVRGNNCWKTIAFSVIFNKMCKKTLVFVWFIKVSSQHDLEP